MGIRDLIGPARILEDRTKALKMALASVKDNDAERNAAEVKRSAPHLV